jgi:hypothetical protein
MWPQIILWVVTTVISYALRPKPEQPRAAGVDEVRAPTAQEGREIPVLFGMREIQGANVVWFGHVRTSAVKRKGGKK